jgi:hypothetical protein
MRNLITGFVVALALVAAGFVGFYIHRSMTYANASATYLFSETEIKGKEGKRLSRADLLDQLLRDAVERAKRQPPALAPETK